MISGLQLRNSFNGNIRVPLLRLNDKSGESVGYRTYTTHVKDSDSFINSFLNYDVHEIFRKFENIEELYPKNVEDFFNELTERYLSLLSKLRNEESIVKAKKYFKDYLKDILEDYIDDKNLKKTLHKNLKEINNYEYIDHNLQKTELYESENPDEEKYKTNYKKFQEKITKSKREFRENVLNKKKNSKVVSGGNVNDYNQKYNKKKKNKKKVVGEKTYIPHHNFDTKSKHIGKKEKKKKSNTLIPIIVILVIFFSFYWFFNGDNNGIIYTNNNFSNGTTTSFDDELLEKPVKPILKTYKLSELENEVINLINEKRALFRLNKLKINLNLSEQLHFHVLEISETEVLTSFDSKGSASDRAKRANIHDDITETNERVRIESNNNEISPTIFDGITKSNVYSKDYKNIAISIIKDKDSLYYYITINTY